MSKVFEALEKANSERRSRQPAGPEGELSSLVEKLCGDSADLEDVSTFPISPTAESRLIAVTEPQSLAAEKLRALAARLRYAQQRRPFKKVLVTSAVRGDGKSLISANLAITLAAQGEKTLLIDGDLHQSSLARVLGTNNDVGFSDWWERRQPITKFIRRAKGMPLWFLPAGRYSEQPLGILQSQETSDLLAQLQTSFNWIIIDSPPLVPLADAGIWANLAETVLFVLRQEVTPKNVVLKSLELLDKSKLFGIVMNEADTTEERYYRGYYSGKGPSSPANRRPATSSSSTL